MAVPVTPNRKKKTIIATERKVWEIIKSAGFEPVADRGIIVKYAPENPGDKTAQFFSMEFYVFPCGESRSTLLSIFRISSVV